MKNNSERMTANYCLKEGNEFLESGTKSDLMKAAKSFMRAYTAGYQKSHIGHIVEACKRLGHTRRLLAAMEDDRKEKLITCVEAVTALSTALEQDGGKILSKDDRCAVVKDIQLVSEEFFKSIDGLKDEVKVLSIRNFMQHLGNDRYIVNSSWIQTVFQATQMELKLYLQAIRNSITNNDFKTALGYIAELTASQDRASRLAVNREEE